MFANRVYTSLPEYLRIIQLIPRRIPHGRREAQPPLLRRPLRIPLAPPRIPPRLGQPQFRPDLVRRHVLLVLVDDRPAERRFLHHDRRQDEPRPDLHKTDLRLASLFVPRYYDRSRLTVVTFVIPLAARFGFGGGGLADLEAADPDFAVSDGEAHDVVDEGLGSAGAFRDAEDVPQELLDEREVRGGVEGGVEGEDGAGAAQAVAGEVEFGCCVDCFLAIAINF